MLTIQPEPEIERMAIKN